MSAPQDPLTPEIRTMLEELERVAGRFVVVDDEGRIVDADDREVDQDSPEAGRRT